MSGPAVLTLANSTGLTSGIGDVEIGDAGPVGSGSFGGNLTIAPATSNAANMQASMGTGNYTIGYGGALTATATSFAPTNAFTVNMGGTIKLNASSESGGIILNSGATFQNSSNIANSATLPTAGVVFYTGNSSTALAAPATLTGTFEFGGNYTGGTTTINGTVAIASPTTLAFDNAGGGSTTISNLC